MKRKISLCIAMCLAVTAASAVHEARGKEPKLKPEELVARHLASIGTAEARSAVLSRAVNGEATVNFRLGGSGQLSGKGEFLSEGLKSRFVLSYGLPEYPGEFFVFDGDKVEVGYIRPGERSHLSEFIFQFDVLVKDGLLGGTLMTGWALLDVQGKKPKLNYGGLKKVEGREVHELSYRPKKGGGSLQIYLYFEPETFRHVMSRHYLFQPANMSAVQTQSARQRPGRSTIWEYFDDFRAVDGLTLPHNYKFKLSIEGMGQSILTDWMLTVETLLANPLMEAKYFTMQR